MGTLPYDAGSTLDVPDVGLFRVQDLTGDGLVDIYDQGAAWVNDGSGAADPFVPADGAPFTPGKITAVEMLDVDGDGDLDLLAGSSGRDGLSARENLGAMQFGPLRPLVRGGGLVDYLGTGRFDTSGDCELAVWRRQFVQVLRRRGPWDYVVESEITPQLDGTSGLPARLFAADLYGTGRDDPIVHASGAVAVARTDAQGAFVDITNLQNGYRRLDFADIDADGLLDGVGSTAAQGKGRWRKNPGPGAALTAGGLLVDGCFNMTAGDVDGDGLADLVALRPTRVVLRRGTGPGTFDPEELVALESFAGFDWVELVDVDGNGGLDIVQVKSRSFGGNVAVLANDGNGNFAPAAVIDLPMKKGGELVWGDLDQDGDLDVWAKADLDSGIYVVENRTVAPLGDVLCAPGVVNSTGEAGELLVYGDRPTASAPLRLVARALPLNTFGIFVGSEATQAPAVAANSVGTLCLAGSIGRYDRPGEIGFAGATGSFDLELDVTQLRDATGSVPATAGATWSFQAWYRDAPAGVPSNFTTGVSVTFE